MKLSLANFPLEFFYDVDKDQFQMLKDIRDCGFIRLSIHCLDIRMYLCWHRRNTIFTMTN